LTLMRAFVLAFVITIIWGVAPSRLALASSSTQTVWFWEDSRTYGWSVIPDVRHGNPPSRVTAKMSLTERCARLVGRLLLRDLSGRVYSTQLEDACIRQGGRI